MTDQLRDRALLFAILNVGIALTAMVLSGMMPRLDRPEAVAVGVTLDLTVLVPVAYHFLVVRPRGWPPVALAPVVLLSLVMATLVLPADRQQTLRVVEALAVPVELGLLGWLSWQAGGALRQAGRGEGEDALEVIRRSTRERLRVDRAAEVLAAELAVLYYALGAWRSRAHAPEGALAFTSHQRSGHAGLVVALLVLSAAEGMAVHLLVAAWSATLAWVLTLLSAYGALWLVADYRATVLRPLLVDGGEVRIRAGLRWQVRVARGQIEAVTRVAPAPAPDTRSLALLATPNAWICFAEPVSIQGPYGMRRRVRRVGLFMDEPAELQRALTAGAG